MPREKFKFQVPLSQTKTKLPKATTPKKQAVPLIKVTSPASLFSNEMICKITPNTRRKIKRRLAAVMKKDRYSAACVTQTSPGIYATFDQSQGKSQNSEVDNSDCCVFTSQIIELTDDTEPQSTSDDTVLQSTSDALNIHRDTCHSSHAEHIEKVKSPVCDADDLGIYMEVTEEDEHGDIDEESEKGVEHFSETKDNHEDEFDLELSPRPCQEIKQSETIKLTGSEHTKSGTSKVVEISQNNQCPAMKVTTKVDNGHIRKKQKVPRSVKGHRKETKKVKIPEESHCKETKQIERSEENISNKQTPGECCPSNNDHENHGAEIFSPDDDVNSTHDLETTGDLTVTTNGIDTVMATIGDLSGTISNNKPVLTCQPKITDYAIPVVDYDKRMVLGPVKYKGGILKKKQNELSKRRNDLQHKTQRNVVFTVKTSVVSNDKKRRNRKVKDKYKLKAKRSAKVIDKYIKQAMTSTDASDEGCELNDFLLSSRTSLTAHVKQPKRKRTKKRLQTVKQLVLTSILQMSSEISEFQTRRKQLLDRVAVPVNYHAVSELMVEPIEQPKMQALMGESGDTSIAFEE